MGTTNSVLSRYGSVKRGQEGDHRQHTDIMSDAAMPVGQLSGYHPVDDAVLRTFKTAISYTSTSVGTFAEPVVVVDGFEGNGPLSRENSSFGTNSSFGNDLGNKLARYFSILVDHSASMEQKMTALEGMYDIRPLPSDILGFRFVFPRRIPNDFTGNISNSWNCIRVPFSVPSDTSHRKSIVFWTESLWTDWFDAMLGALKSADGVLVRTSLRTLAKLFETSETSSELGNPRFQPIAEPPLNSSGGYFDRFLQMNRKQKIQGGNGELPDRESDGSDTKSPKSATEVNNDNSDSNLTADNLSHFFEQVCFSITSSHFVDVMSIPLVEDNIFARRDAAECIHVLHLALVG